MRRIAKQRFNRLVPSFADELQLRVRESSRAERGGRPEDADAGLPASRRPRQG